MYNGVHSSANLAKDHGNATEPLYLQVKGDRLHIGYGCEDAEPVTTVHHLDDLGVVVVATEAEEIFVLSLAEFEKQIDPSPLAA